MNLPFSHHNIKNDIIRIIGSQWLASAYGAGMSILLLLFLSRRLGPSGLANYLYLYNIASLFAIIQDGGFQILIFREKASPTQAFGLQPGELVQGYFGYVIPVTIIGIIFIGILPAPNKLGFVLALFYFGFRCVTNIISSLLKGKGDFTGEALWRVQLQTFLAVPVLILVGLTNPAPEKVFWGLITGQLLLLLTKTGRDSLERPKFYIPPLHIWRTCIAFIIINAATTIYFKSDIVLLRHILGDMVLIGHYGAAFQLLEGVILIATPIVQICFRTLRLNWQDRDLLRLKLSKMLVWTIFASTFIAVAGHFLAPKIIFLAYGDAFAPAASIFSILLIALLFLLPNYILAQGMIALNCERYFAITAVFCAVFNLGLNLILIPIFKTVGAAWATVATEVLLSVLLAGRFFYRR